MGRHSVRYAIQNAVQNAGLDYVGTVFPARPIVAQESAYRQTLTGQAVVASANGSNALLIVNLPDDHRTRYGDVGRGALADFDKHMIAIEIFFACPSGSGIESQDDYDVVIDQLVEFIRENPTMSAPASVWSAGEYRYGVRHTQDMPLTAEDGTTVVINGVVKFEAWEQIIGPIPQPSD